MPELPEVETIARDLENKTKGLKIVDVEVFDRRVIFDLTPAAFIKSIKGSVFQTFSRRGKSVVIGLKPQGYLIIQPKMSGYVIYGQAFSMPPITSATKALFKLSNGSVLHYNDHRMFGWLYYVKDLSDVKYFQNLGAEPLDDVFTLDVLKDTLSRRSSPAKVALMNQALIAGIGNIYASEILFDAGIDPRRKCDTISAPRLRKLHGSIRSILQQAVKERGCSMRDYRDTSGTAGTFMNCIKVYGRDGEKCPRCSSRIQKIVQAQRSTFFCAQCQS